MRTVVLFSKPLPLLLRLPSLLLLLLPILHVVIPTALLLSLLRAERELYLTHGRLRVEILLLPPALLQGHTLALLPMPTAARKLLLSPLSTAMRQLLLCNRKPISPAAMRITERLLFLSMAELLLTLTP